MQQGVEGEESLPDTPVAGGRGGGAAVEWQVDSPYVVAAYTGKGTRLGGAGVVDGSPPLRFGFEDCDNDEVSGVVSASGVGASGMGACVMGGASRDGAASGSSAVGGEDNGAAGSEVLPTPTTLTPIVLTPTLLPSCPTPVYCSWGTWGGGSLAPRF